MLIDELTHSPKRSRSPNANALSNDGVDGKEGAIVDATKSKFDFCEDAIASLHIRYTRIYRVCRMQHNVINLLSIPIITVINHQFTRDMLEASSL